MDRLMHHEFPEAKGHPDMPGLEAGGFITRMRKAGQILVDVYEGDAASVAARSSSDTARGWGAFAAVDGVDSSVQVKRLRSFADDEHFSVREMAWLALRPSTCLQTRSTIEALAALTSANSPFLRRFASEATRPRSVWGRHVALLKRQPWIARAVIDPLRADNSSYVRRSVGNWLNDAARDNPEWVRELLNEWQWPVETAAADVVRRASRWTSRPTKGA